MNTIMKPGFKYRLTTKGKFFEVVKAVSHEVECKEVHDQSGHRLFITKHQDGTIVDYRLNKIILHHDASPKTNLANYIVEEL